MMTKVMSFSNIVFIVSLCIIIIVIISCYILIAKNKYKKKLYQIDEKIKTLLNALEELFIPNRRINEEEIKLFLTQNKSIIDEAKDICERKNKFKKLLKLTYIEKFVEEVNYEKLVSRLSENNVIFDKIEQLEKLCLEQKSDLEQLMSPNHYFAYSEMEELKNFFGKIDTYERVIIPKYKKYITNDEVKRLLRIKENLNQERINHNQDFINNELLINKEYFDTVLGKYPLDSQQRDSIVRLEDNCLVIASAGSGKTSTILGKAKYLIERRNIDPSKVLLITYTRKAANELQERMNIKGLTCSTFHALAYQIISQITGQAPSICNADLSLNVFRKLITSNKDFLHAVNNYIINQQSMMGLEHEYNDAFSYFEDRKKYGIQALFTDADNKIIFTRSEEEKRLVSILTRLGITFRYENQYEIKTSTPERRQYKPDFTIYFQNEKGENKHIYLEHFGIDKAGNVPLWFGEGARGGWREANKKYNEGIKWKHNTHKNYGTTLIYTTSADFKDGTVEEKLRKELLNCGVPIKERSDKELYQLLVQRSKNLENSVYTLILSFITLMKANEKSIDSLLQEAQTKDSERSNNILTYIIKPFYQEYQDELNKNYEIDFTDAIIKATEICRDDLWKNYEYILVDEFQDISIDRYKFLQALRTEKPKTKLFCVGDDWQSIFRFAGSDMSLVYEFEKYFGYTEHCKIETTYRFHQPLIEQSSNFIIKNKEQKEKNIKTPDNDRYKTYLSFEKCLNNDKDSVLKKVEQIVKEIPQNQSIIILGRYNYDAKSVGFNGKIDMKNNRMTVRICDRDLPFLSIHSAKGLEADNVILINCNQGAYGFPSLIEDDPILDFVLSKKEGYPFAEERRLFYVAMTRARMHVYILYNEDKASPFVGEFMLKLERGSYLCPRCLEGKIIAVKEGVASNGVKYRCFKCSNDESGCDFFETKYGNLTPPGIKITESTTIQDIEKLRWVRRKNLNK